MREIKFRAWDKKINELIFEGFHVFGEVTLFNLLQQHCYETKGEGGSLERYSDLEVMQYTGLKDKNAKEIYEGDIMRSTTGYEFVVELKWYKIGQHNSAYGYQHDPNDIIIGNIYENPTLIK